MRTIGLICVAALAACGTDGSSSDGDDTGDGSGSTTEIEINGKPASEFYAQFTHEVTHSYVSGMAAFPEQSDGRNVFGVTFFLMPNRELALFYEEGKGSVSPSASTIAVISDSRRRRSGTWNIDGAQLVLGDWMTCYGFVLDGDEALDCTLEQTVVTPAAVGRAGTFQYTLFATNPDDSRFADYMP